MDKKELTGQPFYLNDQQINWVFQTLDQMNEREKVGQLFCLSISENDKEEMNRMLYEYQIGGYMCRALSADHIININYYMQSHAKIPMLIAANFECGPSGISKDAMDIASSLEIGATGIPAYAGMLGEACAKEGGAFGANWSFAPVADIEYNWRNPIVGTRAYSNNPDVVAACAVEYIKQCQKYGVAASAKHFPGDGLDERDQHLVTSINSFSCKEWDESYGKVYQACISAGVMSIMIGHIMLPSYSKFFCPNMRDEELLPAVCSQELLQELLRKKLKYHGLIVTDATNMAGSLVLVERRTLLIKMINAGCDMLLFTINTAEDIQYICDAVNCGAISQKRLNDAVIRILALKAALHLPEKREKGELKPKEKQIYEYIHNQTHKTIADQIANQSVTLVKDTQNLLPVSPQKHRRIYLYVIADTKEPKGNEVELSKIIGEKLQKQGFSVTYHNNHTPLAAFGKQQSYQEMKASYDLILYVFNIATYSNKTTVRINWENLNYPAYIPLIPTLAVSFANPYHLVDIPRIRTLINAYKFNENTVDAVVNKLLGRSPFLGKNPVDPFCGMWDTKL